MPKHLHWVLQALIVDCSRYGFRHLNGHAIANLSHRKVAVSAVKITESGGLQDDMAEPL
jgi:hypothetical protein